MSDKITYTTRYDNFPHFHDSHPDDPFMLNGCFTEEYMKKCVEQNETISRASENITPIYMVYENDNLPLETQLEIINEIEKKYIRYITFSGHKSYHVLFKIKVPENITKDEYRKAWFSVMKGYDLLKYADTQCGTLSRLTRNPGGFNPDYNMRQTCIYDNPGCESIDLFPLINKIRLKDLEHQRHREIEKKYSQKDFSSKPEEALSQIKKECEAKIGYDMWKSGNFPKGYNYLGCARGMYTICMMKNCNEVETIEFCRQFLLAVSAAHPTNISRNKALNWKPQKSY